MTDPPLSRQMPCCACAHESHGLLAVLPTTRKANPMTVQSTGSGFVATCPRCRSWSTTSQTRRVVEQRLREHEEGCK